MAFHRIQVVDSETGRGIPTVELRTTDSRIFYTDSAGVVAFCEPELMGTRTWFTITSFGYMFPPNAFGQQGRVVEIEPGGNTILEMKRVNVAQRLYRITGSDIYRDSVLLGEDTPPTQDWSPTPVTGMDSVHAIRYRGKMYWFWGDTGMTPNPLGNFRATGATSELPGQGGLDPSVGVHLTFFRNENGAVMPMFSDDRRHPIWVSSARVVEDENGEEHLFVNYSVIIGNMRGLEEEGIARFDDEAGYLKSVFVRPEGNLIWPGGLNLRHEVGGREYFYFNHAWAHIRCPADLASVTDMDSLEAFTCVRDGVRFTGEASQLDRDAEGNLRWAWRRNTSPANQGNLDTMLRRGLISQRETPYSYQDTNTTETIRHHGGSIYYNPHRGRWISVFSQLFGRASFLGEVWYAEADTPLGPWVYSQKIVTHRMGEAGIDATTYARQEAYTYSFYNPKIHLEFLQDGGRTIYFEGTYTSGFTSNQFRTPGYDYNQIMYSLDLDDPRLYVPVPVYRISDSKSALYRTKKDIPAGTRRIERAFFAPDRERPGTVAVYEVHDDGTPRLSLTPGEGAERVVAFYAASPDEPRAEYSPMADLYEYVGPGGDRIYSTEDDFAKDGYMRSEKPLCRVWPNPIKFDPLALELAGL